VGAALAVAAFTGKAYAGPTQNIDIHVSISNTKSLSAGTTFYNFGALAVNVASNSATALVITNDSAALIETYRIQGANATSDTGGTNWSLAAATGTDTYALAAEFSNARPANSDASWSSCDTTLAAVTCSAAQFGNGTAAESGLLVSPAAGVNTRNLWFRIKTPGVVTDPSGHTATVTLSVL